MPRRLLPRPPRDVGMRGSVLLLLGVIWIGVGALSADNPQVGYTLLPHSLWPAV